jgi:hypoxia up-regulated 1
VVEIIGGGVRVPRVQAILAEYFGALPVGTHLNGDEASVMGAAFVAANRSSAFRVKPVGALDTTPFSISLNLTSLHPEDDLEEDGG